MRLFVNARALALLMLGSALPCLAQTDSGATVTVFRGGTSSSSIPISPGLPELLRGSVTIIAGDRITKVTPQQTSELPGAALAIGAGAGMSGGTIALPTR